MVCRDGLLLGCVLVSSLGDESANRAIAVSVSGNSRALLAAPQRQEATCSSDTDRPLLLCPTGYKSAGLVVDTNTFRSRQAKSLSA